MKHPLVALTLLACTAPALAADAPQVPYPDGYEQAAQSELKEQTAKIVANLESAQIKADPDKEIIALIAYLQRLGTDIKAQQQTTKLPASEETAQLAR